MESSRNVHLDPPGLSAAQSYYALRELALAAAVDAGDADDLSAGHLQAHVVHRDDPTRALHRYILQAERRLPAVAVSLCPRPRWAISLVAAASLRPCRSRTIGLGAPADYSDCVGGSFGFVQRRALRGLGGRRRPRTDHVQ